MSTNRLSLLVTLSTIVRSLLSAANYTGGTYYRKTTERIRRRVVHVNVTPSHDTFSTKKKTFSHGEFSRLVFRRSGDDTHLSCWSVRGYTPPDILCFQRVEGVSRVNLTKLAISPRSLCLSVIGFGSKDTEKSTLNSSLI